jgi:hypothetical protein
MVVHGVYHGWGWQRPDAPGRMPMEQGENSRVVKMATRLALRGILGVRVNRKKDFGCFHKFFTAGA